MQYLKDRIKSFGFALRGIGLFFKSGPHAKIHAIAALLVLFGGMYFRVSVLEWALLILSIVIVFAAEAFNTAIEELADIIEPDFDKRIGRIKDISAGAVSFAVISSLIVLIIIYYPYISTCLK